MCIMVEIKGLIDLGDTIISFCVNSFAVFCFSTSEAVVVSSEGLSPQAKVNCRRSEVERNFRYIVFSNSVELIFG